MGEFDGKSVIVTGGAVGIGAAAARAFAREGARVAIGDVDCASGEVTTGEIREAGGEAIFVEADVSSITDCERLVSETAERFGGVDILFNNAGIQPPDSYLTAVDTPEETWDRIIGVNLKSRFLMAKYAIPEMRKRGGGVIISTASVQGQQSMNKVPAYAASKGGDLSLMRQMALDFAPDNIRVLALCPGGVDTPMLRASVAGKAVDIDQAVNELGRVHPLGRIATGDDMADAVLFLASNRASFMTGEFINVDGGLMAMGAWAAEAGAAQT